MSIRNYQYSPPPELHAEVLPGTTYELYAKTVREKNKLIADRDQEIIRLKSEIRKLNEREPEVRVERSFLPWFLIFVAIFATCLIFTKVVIPPIQEEYYYQGSEDGYYDGTKDGYADGYEAGKSDGYNDGYSDGYSVGHNSQSSRYNPPSNSSSSNAVLTQTVYVTNTGSKYHRAGCSYLKSSREISLGDAIAAGYTPCSRCKP